MKPTVGRIVHYHPQPSDEWGEQGNPVAAVVVRVWSDDCVNLRLLTDTEVVPWVTSVPYSGDRVDFSWSWPPRE